MNKEQEIADKLQAHRAEKAVEKAAENKTLDVKKFSTEELTKISTIKTTYDQVTLRIGQIHFELTSLQDEKTRLEEMFNDNRKTEVKFAEDLSVKYGKGTLDIETGIFTPVE